MALPKSSIAIIPNGIMAITQIEYICPHMGLHSQGLLVDRAHILWSLSHHTDIVYVSKI